MSRGETETDRADVAEAEAGAARPRPEKPDKQGFTFTEPGCRTEVRLGTLLVLGSVFLWLWLGPAISSLLYFIGLPLILVGAPLQAWQARRHARPGYPLKLAIVLTVGGAAMWPDLTYREVVGGPLHVQPVAPMLLVAGAWMLAWWPLARMLPAERSG